VYNINREMRFVDLSPLRDRLSPMIEKTQEITLTDLID